jgi:short-subunit dehydrogenase
MTKNVLDIFKKRYQSGKAKHSLIINTSAMAAIAPFPYLGNYGAAKLFGDFLVEPLNYELKEYGVDVTAVRPAGVITKLTSDKLNENDKTAVTAEECAVGTCSKVTSGI